MKRINGDVVLLTVLGGIVGWLAFLLLAILTAGAYVEVRSILGVAP